MKHNISINNPVTLHFYSPEDRLPDKDDWSYKIVVRKSILTDSFYDFCIAQYYRNEEKWTDDHLYEIDDVIAWATFSPGWVVSENDRDIFGCK